uniref:Putative secreted peptide n=1 Tax=Anopheles braziliensis TaxID=58242 RepID=A0A2M3ZVC4_9DIPT
MHVELLLSFLLLHCWLQGSWEGETCSRQDVIDGVVVVAANGRTKTDKKISGTKGDNHAKAHKLPKERFVVGKDWRPLRLLCAKCARLSRCSRRYIDKDHRRHPSSRGAACL